MPVKKILKFPEPLLREVSRAVTSVGDNEREVVRDLLDTMAASPGVGLAAPQIGVLKRIAVVDVTRAKKGKKAAGKGNGKGNGKESNAHGLLVLVNPVIVESSGRKTMREGCLSIPEYLADITRAKRITVKALNVGGAEGSEITIEASGFEAIAIQHEIDHLDGILFIDRITSIRGLLKRKLREGGG